MGAGVGLGVGTDEAAGTADVVGSALEDATGSADAVGSLLGWPELDMVGVGVPGVEVEDGCVDDAASVGITGMDAAGTSAVPGVGPAAVVGGDCSPEIPTLRATVARTRLTIPRARTSRRRCAAVTSARVSSVGRAGHEPPPRRRW